MSSMLYTITLSLSDTIPYQFEHESDLQLSYLSIEFELMDTIYILGFSLNFSPPLLAQVAANTIGVVSLTLNQTFLLSPVIYRV